MYLVQEIAIQNNPKPVANLPSGGTQAFYPSLVQSFLVIFLSEIADRTFILVLIYSLKMHWIPLILTSLFAMYFMNILAIVAGYTVILLIPRSLLDWIGFFCFLLFGIFSVYEGMQMESKSVKASRSRAAGRAAGDAAGGRCDCGPAVPDAASTCA